MEFDSRSLCRSAFSWGVVVVYAFMHAQPVVGGQWRVPHAEQNLTTAVLTPSLLPPVALTLPKCSPETASQRTSMPAVEAPTPTETAGRFDDAGLALSSAAALAATILFVACFVLGVAGGARIYAAQRAKRRGSVDQVTAFGALRRASWSVRLRWFSGGMRTAVTAVVIVAMLLPPLPVRVSAAERYFDPDLSTTGNDAVTGDGLGGAGTWNVGFANWWNPISGLLEPWNDAAHDTAIFAGLTAGTVTLEGAQTVGGLHFRSTGYTLSGDALLLAALNNTITVDRAVTATLASQLLGSNGFTLTGGGRLVLAAASNGFTGKIRLESGTLAIDRDAQLGQVPGGATADAIEFIDDATLQVVGTNNPTLHANRGLTIGAGVLGTLDVVEASNTVSYGGLISLDAAGTLRKRGAGTLSLTADQTALLGTLAVDGGTLRLLDGGLIGAAAGVTLGNRGVITLDNDAINVSGRLAGSLLVQTGTLNLIGNDAGTNETIDDLTINGAMTINTEPGVVGNTLTITNLTRNAGGSLFVQGVGLGAGQNQVYIGNAPASINGLVPWLVVNDGTVVRFAEHGANGLVPVLGGYAATENLWTANTVNALPAAGTTSVAGTRSAFTLTLDNGVLIRSSSTSADRTFNIAAGILQTGGLSTFAPNSSGEVTVDFGTSQALIYTVGDLTMTRQDKNNLSGSAGFIKAGPGVLSVSVNGNTGPILLNEGTYRALGSATTALGPAAASLELNGGKLVLAHNAAVAYALAGAINVNADTVIGFERTSAGTGYTSTIAGGLTIGNRKVSFVSDGTLWSANTSFGLRFLGTTNIVGAPTFDVGLNGTGLGLLTLGQLNNPDDYVITKTGGGRLFSTVGFHSRIDLQEGFVGWDIAAGEMEETAILSGAGGIIKSGTGTLELSSTNTFTGGVSVQGGTLKLTGTNTFAGAVSIGATTGANLLFTQNSLGTGTAEIAITGAAPVSLLSFIGSADYTVIRPINVLSSGHTIDASGVGGATVTYAGAITTGAFSLALTGSGKGVISGGIIQTGTSSNSRVFINSGDWTITGASTAFADDLLIGGDGTILRLDGANVVGFTAGTGNFVYVRDGALLQLKSDGALSTAAGLEGLLVGLDSAGTGGMPKFDSGTFSITIPRLDVGNFAAGLEGDVFGSGTITVNGSVSQISTANSTLLTSGSLNLRRGTVSANLAGTAPMEFFGLDTFTLSGDNSGLSGTAATRIQSGTVILDYTANNASKIRASAPLNAAGGTLILNGSAAENTVQDVASTTLANGGSSVILINHGTGRTATLNLGAITRSAGAGTLRLGLSSASYVTTTTGNDVLTGLLGTGTSFATVKLAGQTYFAKNDGTGNIVAQTYAGDMNDPNSWTAGIHATDSAGGFTDSLASSQVIGSLRFNAAGPSTLNLDPGVYLAVQGGGVLQTDQVTTGKAMIAGGNLVAGGGEFVFTADSATQTLEVQAALIGSAVVTKSGAGTVLLNSGNNLYSGGTTILSGTLQVAGGNAISDTSLVTLPTFGAAKLQLLADETIGGLVGGSISAPYTLLTVVDIGSHSLTISPASGATSTYYGQFTGDGTLIKNGLNGALNIAGSSADFTGSIVVNEGLFYITGSAGRLANATSVTVNKGGVFLVDNNDDSAPNDRLSDTFVVRLNSADGTFNNSTIVRGLSVRTDNNSNETEVYGSLYLDSGANYVTVEGTGTNTGTIAGLEAAIGWNRAAGVTANVRGRSLGATTGPRSTFKIANANDADFMAANLVGGGAVVGASNKNISIVPWAVGQNLTGAATETAMGNTLLTYVDNRGFVALDPATEFAAYAAAGVQDNVRASLVADLTGLNGKTINSLVLHNDTVAGDSAISVTGIGAGQTLTVASGAFLFTLNSTAANSSLHGVTLGGFNGGIAIGSTGEYVFHVVNPSSLGTTPQLTATIASPLVTSASIVKSGRGTLVLTGNNTAGGGVDNATYLNEGVLQIADLDQIGGNTGGLVFAGGTLRLSAGFADDLSLRTISILPGGAFLDTNGNDVTLAGAWATGTGGFTKLGLGNLTLSAAAGYTGGTTLLGGTLTLGHAAGISGGSLSISGASTFDLGSLTVGVAGLSLSNEDNVLLGSGTFNVAGSAVLNRGTVPFALAGTMNLIKLSSQTLTLGSVPSTYTGYTHVQEGVLSVGSLSAIGAPGPLGAPTAANAAVRLGNLTTSGTLRYTGGAVTLNRSLVLAGSSGGGIFDNDGTGAVNLTGEIYAIQPGTKQFTLQGDYGTVEDPNIVSGQIRDVAGVVGVTKSESGMWLLSVANTHTGGTTIAAGALLFGHDAAGGSGTLTLNAGELQAYGAARTISNVVSVGTAAAVAGTLGITFEGTVTGVSGGNRVLTNNISGGLLTIAALNLNADAAANRSFTLAGTGNTTINAITADRAHTFIITNSGTTLLLSAGNYTGASTLNAANGVLQLGGVVGGHLGTGTFNFTAGTVQAVDAERSIANAVSLTAGTISGSYGLTINGILSGVTGASRTLTNDIVGGMLTLGDVNLNVETGNNRSLTFAGSGTTVINGVVANGAAGRANNLIVNGTGTVVLNNSANTYSGITTIANGTLKIGAENAVSTTTINLGSGATAGRLDLTAASQAVTTFSVLSNSDVNTNEIVVGAGRTLTVNGLFTVGLNTAANTNTRLTASGAGGIVVNSNNGNLVIGAAIGSANSSNPVVDMSGLATLTANLGTGVFRVGDESTGSGVTSASFVKLAQNTSIYAAAFRVGDIAGPVGLHAVVLGSGTNVIHATTVNIGANGSTTTRSSGALYFDPSDTTGTLLMRASDGTGRITLNMINNTVNTAGAMTSIVDFRGHTVDVLADVVTMAYRTATSGSTAGSATSELSFDRGTLDISTLRMASKTTTAHLADVTATVNLGNTQPVGTSSVKIGNIVMATNTSGATGTATAVLNISGGNVEIGAGSGTAINMVNAAASRTATSSINLTGGNVLIRGDVVRTGTAGSSETTTILLDGAVLDLGGFVIGDAAKPIGFDLRSGTLKNLGELNGGAAVTKTSAGTLTLDGVHTFSGALVLEAGRVVLAGGANDRIDPAKSVTIGTELTGVVLQLGNAAGASNQAFSSVTVLGSGSSVVGGNAAMSTLTWNADAHATLAAVGGNGANENNISLVKNGAGTLRLGAASYVGQSVVNSGRVEVLGESGAPPIRPGLTVGNNAAYALFGATTTGSSIHTFSGLGSVMNLGGVDGASLGFSLNGAYHTGYALTAGQWMTLNGTLNTEVFVNGAPISGQEYVLIDAAQYGAFAGPGNYDPLALTIFNGGNFVYSLRRETLGNTVDRWILTANAQAAAPDVWWRGDLTGAASGIWSAVVVSGQGAPTNWDASQYGNDDAVVAPDATSTVHFSAALGENFDTVLGQDMTIRRLMFHAGWTTINIGGANTLTLGNTVDSAGILSEAGAPNVNISANVHVAQNQTWQIADGSTLMLTGNLTGPGLLTIESGNFGRFAYAAAPLTLGTLTLGTAAAGGTLQLGNADLATTLTLNTLLEGAFGSNRIVGGNAAASTLVIDGAGPNVFNGILGGLGVNENNLALILRGGGTLTLNGYNTATGGTQVFNGRLVLGNAASLSGDLTLRPDAGGTSVFDLNDRSVTLGTLTLGTPDGVTLPEIISAGGTGFITLSGGLTYEAANNMVAWSVDDYSFVLDGATTFDIGKSAAVAPGTAEVTFNTAIIGFGGFTKTGDGTLRMNASNGYLGMTTLERGTIYFEADQAIGGLTLGGAANSANPVTLDATNGSATFAGTFVMQINSAVASQFIIGTGRTTTFSGSVTIGSNHNGSTQTVLQATGGGAFVVNNATSGSLFVVGGTTSGSGIGSRTIADFSGLSSLTISLNTANGIIRINPSSSSNVDGRYSTFILPSTGAGTVNITAAALTVGDGGQYNNSAGQVNTLLLGSGVNTIHVNTINIGTGLRDIGRIAFNTETGSIVLRSADGVGAVALNMGTGTTTTGVGSLTTALNSFDVSGHHADLKFGTVNMGTQNRRTSFSNYFNFDQGSLEIATLNLAARGGDSGANVHHTLSEMNLGGGDVAIGAINMASSTGSYSTGGYRPILESTINISGGAVSIGTGSGTAITMATSTITGGVEPPSGTPGSYAVINLTGGVATLSGDIVRGAVSGVGAASAVINLAGGTLDMSGHAVGTDLLPVTLNLQSGTLRNLGEYNSGGVLTKAGSGTLVMAGTNNYAGDTAVNEGVLLINGTNAGSGSFSVADGATLGGGGSIAGAVTVVAGGILNPGTVAGAGTFTLSSLVLDGGLLHFQLGANLLGQSDRILLTGGAAPTFGLGSQLFLGQLAGLTADTYQLITGFTGGIATFGNLTLMTTTLGNFEFQLQATDTALNLIVSSIHVGPRNLTWAGSESSLWNATAANWLGEATVYAAGDLVTFDDSTTVRDVGIEADVAPGAIVVNTAGTYTFTGAAITGSTDLLKQGLGTLVLAGSHTFTGPTTVAGGTLQLRGNYASAVDVAGNRLQLNTDATQQITGVLSGSGTIEKLGAGTATLTAANTFSGTTDVRAGTLSVAGSLGGAIVVNGGALVAQSTASISNAAGIQVDAGNFTAQSGSNVVGGGIVQVGGAAQAALFVADGRVNGSVVVRGQGTLKGTGILGGVVVQSGGTLAPGNSVGKLTIDDGEVTGTGALDLHGSSSITFEFSNAAGGASAPGNHWDFVDLVGGALNFVNVDADHKIQLNLVSLQPDGVTPGAAANFTFAGLSTYEWLFIAAGSLNGLSESDINDSYENYFVLNDDAVFSDGGGPFGRPLDESGQGSQFGLAWKTGANGTGLYITFTAVPEPSSMLLTGLGTLAAAWYGKRRRKQAAESETPTPAAPI